MSAKLRYRCPACDCHTLPSRDSDDICPLCWWHDDLLSPMYDDNGQKLESPSNEITLSAGRKPYHPLFAKLRHPILGPRGETAIDRVLLRERAYLEFRERLRNAGESAELPQRLIDLLDAIRAVDRLYAKD